ncbi:MAG: ATP-binding protein [Syntrophomonadaceae bacterium]|nr:ATP-binding protein [Syntrophomonadaceae bacterium]
MLNQETLNKLKHMKLTGMVEALAQQESNPSHQEMSFQERLGLLVDWEFNKCQHNRLKRLISSAKFQNATACVEDISYRDDRQLDRNLILELATCNFVPHAQNIIIVGPTGAGGAGYHTLESQRSQRTQSRVPKGSP